jgi:hypothetical protein
MTRVVYKYELTPEVGAIVIPEGSQLLHVDVQGDKAYVWALVDSDADDCYRRLVVVATGQPLPKDVGAAEHIGTFVVNGLVFHAFDWGEAPVEAPVDGGGA